MPFLALLALAMTLFCGTALCQTISDVKPNVISAGSMDTTVEATGLGLVDPQGVWINCSLVVPPSRVLFNSATSVSVRILASQLAVPQSLFLTAQQCAPGITGASLQVSAIAQTAPLGQILVGVDVTAASATDPHAVFLADSTLDLPLSSARDVSKPIFWIGGDLKLAGIAQPGSLSNLTSASALTGYLAPAVNGTPDKIVQSFQGSGFLAFQFLARKVPIGTFDSGTKPLNPQTLVTWSVVFSGGAVTPLSASQASPPVYEATTQIQAQYPGTFPPASCTVSPGSTPPCFVAFVPNDRSHFYRHYEFGFRIKLYAEDNRANQLRFPGNIDITAGQDEYVTGGKLRSTVIHIGGMLPIPGIDAFYGFGSIDLSFLHADQNGSQLLLIPAPATANLTFTSPSVTTISVSQPNRDRYSFGVAVDLVHLLEMIKQKH